MNGYVLTHWHASNTPDKDGHHVNIGGRKGGIISFLLTLIGLQARVSLQVKADGLHYRTQSMFGNSTSTTPLSKITTTIYGWSRPIIESIVLAVVVFWEMDYLLFYIFKKLFYSDAMAAVDQLKRIQLLGILSSGSGVLAGLAVGGLYYYLNRLLTLGVVVESGGVYWIKMKRSVIEGIKLDESLAESASKVIDTLVLAQCTGTQAGAPPPQHAANPPPPAPPPLSPRPTVTPYKRVVAQSPSPPAIEDEDEMTTRCANCWTKIAFPSEGVGQEIPCPSCGKPVLLEQM